MTWTAPTLPRSQPPYVADEAVALPAWLDHHRDTLLLKCAGLTGEQLVQRAVPPSSLSLLGLVRHMAEVERSWFQRRLEGSDVPWIYCGPDGSTDGDFDDLDAAAAESDFASLAREVARSKEIAQAHALDDTFHHPRLDADIDLRGLYVHMIEDYARHNGHADLLRERIDGVTGD